MPYTNPTQTQAWKQLHQQFQRIQETTLHELFVSDPQRAERFSFQYSDLLVDLSKNWIDADIFQSLLKLADEMQINSLIEAMFEGVHINLTEDRPVLHTALRAKNQNLTINGELIQSAIDAELAKVADFCARLHEGKLVGTDGDPINTIINIGIGGSDLGPRLVNEALSHYAVKGIETYFVANVDVTDLNKVLSRCNPKKTMVIIASKTFTTLETMMNARSARAWLEQNGCHDQAKHFVAVTANIEAAQEFGIDTNNIFAFWSWVGGRYSVWSTIGLPIAAFLGMERFRQLLDGAAEIDEHFRSTPAAENIPILLGLLDVLYSNFAMAQTQAIVPYDHNLLLLPDYLSQLIMESNGKSVNREGEPIDFNTAPIIWGSAGTNGQHAFFQLLHQGTHITPIDFLVGRNNQYDETEHQRALYANCIAQSEALMLGQKPESEKDHYRNYPGNKPSTTMVYNVLDPRTLGMILAIYEHRTFVQGAIYNINSFDQWGVELGKRLASDIIDELSQAKILAHHDSSTQQLLKTYLKN